jgi:membrane protein implicated in regulation of membrane protease activity
MTDEGQGVHGLEGPERDALLAWVRENLTEVRETVSGQRVPYWILGIGFVVGLAAHVGGFLLKTSESAELVSLVADLLYALGLALWTGIVVAIFVQLWPAAKRRHYQQALEAYESARRPRPRLGRRRTRVP